jgi:hypothetical protein
VAASPVRERSLSARAMVIGLLCSLAVCVLVAYAELVIKDIQIAICQFSPAAIGIFLLVVLGNKLAGRFSRRLALSPGELMVVYCMVLVTALTSSRGLMEKLIPGMIAVNYYTTPENHWSELFYPHIRQWMVPFDVRGEGQQVVSAHFYEGLGRASEIPWALWARPLLAWSIVVLAVFFVFLSTAGILRKQWVDNEKLTFPLVQLPLDMVSRKRGVAFFADKLTWIGFAIPAIIFGLNGLHQNYPQVPEVPLRYRLNPYFKSRPWSDMYSIQIFGSMAAVGFAYFLPAQLLFSLWVFFGISRVQDVVASAMGARLDRMPLYPTRLTIGYQSAGAYLVLTGYYVRAALPHLRQVWRRASGRESEALDRDELLPYRVCVFGLLVAVVIAVQWSVRAGMAPWLAMVEMAVYLFVVAVVMARSVSEAGMLMTETSFRPIDLVRMFTTQHRLGKANITALCFTDAVFTRDLRGCLLSTFLDTLKISDGVAMPRRHLLAPIGLGIGTALIAGAAIQLWLPYQLGASGMYSYAYWGNPLWTFRNHAPALEIPDAYDYRLPVAFGAGAVTAACLSLGRMRFWWWPLYPLGYALMGSWTMIVFWFPVLVAWLIKSVLIRYFGMHAYMRLRPFFLGLILGEFFMAVLWASLGCIWRVKAPFFPWP